MNESDMWKYLKVRVHQVDGLFVQRVTDRLAQGIADVYFSVSPAFSGWFEMKAQPSQHAKLKFRAGQVSWLMSLARNGTKCGVLVRVTDGWVWIPAENEMRWADEVVSREWYALPRNKIWTVETFSLPSLLAAISER